MLQNFYSKIDVMCQNTTFEHTDLQYVKTLLLDLDYVATLLLDLDYVTTILLDLDYAATLLLHRYG